MPGEGEAVRGIESGGAKADIDSAVEEFHASLLVGLGGISLPRLLEGANPDLLRIRRGGFAGGIVSDLLEAEISALAETALGRRPGVSADVARVWASSHRSVFRHERDKRFNLLLREFLHRHCLEDGSIDWGGWAPGPPPPPSSPGA